MPGKRPGFGIVAKRLAAVFDDHIVDYGERELLQRDARLAHLDARNLRPAIDRHDPWPNARWPDRETFIERGQYRTDLDIIQRDRHAAAQFDEAQGGIRLEQLLGERRDVDRDECRPYAARD